MNPAQLLSHFDRIGEAPDAIPRLRRFVLALAVRGKLVEQDPRDESASKLLEKIKNQKLQMILEKRIRGEQDVEYSPPATTPEIPTSWAWAHIDDVAIVQGGKRLPKGATFSKEPTEHIYIRVTDMKNGTISPDRLHYIAPEVQHLIARYTIRKEDLYITIAGTIGQVGRVPAFFDGHNLTENAAKIVFRGLYADFLCMVLSSDWVQQQFKDKTKQMAQPKLALKRILGAKFPLPPLAEQHRIVAKVDELMALCDRLEASQTERESRRDRLVASSLHRLNNGADVDAFREHARFYFNHLPRLTTRPDHIKQLRQTILNLAVRGKLVPQDPTDNPASELLKHIKAKKAQMAKEGKRKRDVPLFPIDDTQAPFTLPPTWNWARFPELGIFGRGKSKHRPRNDRTLFNGGTHLLVQTGDVARSKGVIETYTSKYNEIGLAQSMKWPKGTLCITIAANIADSGILSFDACFPDSVVGFIPSSEFPSAKYFEYFLRTAKADLLAFAPATAQKNINLEILNSVLIPIPPLAEQHRIVAKVDELMALCNQLETQLTTTQSESHRLLEAILHEALAKPKGKN